MGRDGWRRLRQCPQAVLRVGEQSHRQQQEEGEYHHCIAEQCGSLTRRLHSFPPYGSTKLRYFPGPQPSRPGALLTPGNVWAPASESGAIDKRVRPRRSESNFELDLRTQRILRGGWLRGEQQPHQHAERREPGARAGTCRWCQARGRDCRYMTVRHARPGPAPHCRRLCRWTEDHYDAASGHAGIAVVLAALHPPNPPPQGGGGIGADAEPQLLLDCSQRATSCHQHF